MHGAIALDSSRLIRWKKMNLAKGGRFFRSTFLPYFLRVEADKLNNGARKGSS